MPLTTSPAHELGHLLAQHPMGWWMAGMLASALLALGGLAGLRGLRRAGPPLRRFAPIEARWWMLAAMAAAGGALAVAGVVLAELAESGAEGPWGVLDDALATGLRAQADTHVLRWFATLTHLGDTWVLTALALAVAGALWWRQHRLLATGWLLALAGNGVLTRILKNVFERVRPEHTHGVAEALGYSFPSGHSFNSAVVYIGIALAFAAMSQRASVRLTLITAAIILSLAVAWSRIWLGVPFPTDVVAGWLGGAGWAFLAAALLQPSARRVAEAVKPVGTPPAEARR